MAPTSLPLGVCVLAFDARGQVALVTRPGQMTRFCLPGGKVEAGETLSEAAAREMQEETGLAVDPALLWPVFEGGCPGDGGAARYWVTAFVLGQPVERLPGSQEPNIMATLAAPDALLHSSPFACFNRVALAQAAADIRAMGSAVDCPELRGAWTQGAERIDAALAF